MNTRFIVPSGRICSDDGGDGGGGEGEVLEDKDATSGDADADADAVAVTGGDVALVELGIVWVV